MHGFWSLHSVHDANALAEFPKRIIMRCKEFAAGMTCQLKSDQADHGPRSLHEAASLAKEKDKNALRLAVLEYAMQGPDKARLLSEAVLTPWTFADEI